MTPLVTGRSSPRRNIEPPTRPPQKTSLRHTQRNCLEIKQFPDTPRTSTGHDFRQAATAVLRSQGV